MSDGTFNSRVLGDGAGERWLFHSAQLDAISGGGRYQLAAHQIVLVLDLREAVRLDAPRHGVPVQHVPLHGRAEGPPSTGSDRGLPRSDHAPCSGGGAGGRCPRGRCRTGPGALRRRHREDRTGLVVALALRAAGVPVGTVLADYALSAREVFMHRSDTVTATLGALPLDDDERRCGTELLLYSPPEAMADTLREVDSLGGLVRYLVSNGPSEPQLAGLRLRGGT